MLFEHTVESIYKYIFDKYKLNKYKYLMNNYYRTELKNIILETSLKILIYLINEKRLNNELIGDKPQKRYYYFDQVLGKKSYIWEEIIDRFPNLYLTVIKSVLNYVDCINDIYNNFKNDKQLLISNNMLKNQEISIPFIKILGDIHNKKAVALLNIGKESLIYKPRTIKNELLFYRIFKIINKKQPQIGYIERSSYHWEQFIKPKSVNTEKDIREYYIKVGRLLAVSYYFNISDLHHENIIASDKNIHVTDLETIFNVSPFNPRYTTKAEDKIIRYLMKSVTSTGLLPLASCLEAFGGDSSGILGGSYVGERRIIKNAYRDDICLKKELSTYKDYNHVPYFENQKLVEYVNPKNYFEEILKGFKEAYKILLTSKNKLFELINQYKEEIQTRILFRNTKDYGIILDLLKSPIYSENRDFIYQKLNSLKLDGNTELLVNSEIKQLENRSIPIFYCKINKKEVYDNDGNIIYIFKESPLERFYRDWNNYSLDDLENQVDIIVFSMDMIKIRDNENIKKNKNYEIFLNQGLKKLLSYIFDKAIFAEEDNSINWLNVGMTDGDMLQLEPLNNSIYNGLSGLLLALLEVYKYKPKYVNLDILLTLVNTIKLNYHTMHNDSFYCGKLGILSVLQKVNELGIFDIKHRKNDFQSELVKISKQMCNSNEPDFLYGISGFVVAIISGEVTVTCKKEILHDMYEKLIKLRKRHNNESYWYQHTKGVSNVSLCHGNSGVATAFLYIYSELKEKQILEDFKDAWNYDKKRLLTVGWIDNRNKDKKPSPNWCHGSTGILVSRLNWLKLNKNKHLLSLTDIDVIKNEINHAKNHILKEGLNIDSFTLCHGISGNLLALLGYINSEYCSKEERKKIIDILKEKYLYIYKYGMNENWMCGYGTHFQNYSLFTGITGIIYSTVKFLQNDTDSILFPVF